MTIIDVYNELSDLNDLGDVSLESLKIIWKMVEGEATTHNIKELMNYIKEAKK